MRTEREVTITAGGTKYDFRLADRPGAYRVGWQTVWPASKDTNSGDPYTADWHINEWSGGEGEDLWQGEDTYDKSTNVTPKQVGDGLVLGASQSTTVNDNATPATFTEGLRFGLAQGKLWSVKDGSAHFWQPTTSDWDETGWSTGEAGSDTPTSVIDQGDGTNIIIGYDDGASHHARQVSSGADAAITGLTYDYAPVFRNWGGTLFWLDGDDLYDFTMSGAAATETLRADVSGRSDDYLTNGFEVYNRLSSSDKGPIWFQRLDNGQTFIHEWNVNTSTHQVLAKLPVDFASPYSLFFANGFYFCGFRYAEDHAGTGDAYVFGFRNAQRFLAGPVREATDGTTASRALLIAGMIGDDLTFYFDGAMWAYNLTSGGLSQISDSAGTDHTKPTEAITFGKSIFLANMSDLAQVERHDRRSYTTRTATWDSGRYDFDTPGITKALLSVTVVTEPLPSAASVALSVAADGGSFTAVTGTHSDTDATSKTWTVSSSDADVTGTDFELRLTLATTDSSVTPTIRSITARAVSVERRRVTRFEPDARNALNVGDAPRSSDVLKKMRELGAYNGVVKMTSRIDDESYKTPITFDGTIDSVEAHEVNPGDESPPFIVVREVVNV
jgi:hypothetical protein